VAKIDWKFWKGFLFGALTLLALLVAIITGIAGLLNNADPQILAAQNCIIWAESNIQEVRFEILINNAGSKDISAISIDLVWPDGSNADIEGYKPPLPKTIPPGQTERIVIIGYCHPFDRFNGFARRGKLKLQPDQTTIEGTAVVKFNTKDIISKKITFTIEHLK